MAARGELEQGLRGQSHDLKALGEHVANTADPWTCERHQLETRVDAPPPIKIPLRADEPGLIGGPDGRPRRSGPSITHLDVTLLYTRDYSTYE